MFAVLRQDVRYGLRALLRNRTFAIVAVLSLGLAVGANSAVLSVLDAVSWRKLPVLRPQELVITRLLWAQQGRYVTLSHPLFAEVAGRKDIFRSICAAGEFGISQARISGREPIARVTGRLVTSGYFSVLGTQPAAGRLIQPGESGAVCVISDSLWQRQWGRSPAAIGTSLMINRVETTIIGVTRPEFFGDRMGASPDVYVPMDLQPQLLPGLNWLTNWRNYWLTVLGRLQPGVGRQAAEAALQSTLAQAFEKQGRKPSRGDQLVVEPGARGLSNLESQFGRPLYILMAVAGLLLLIGCGNLANLLLARAAAREREMSIRVAIGAGRRRLVAQVLTECLLLSGAGCLVALPIAVYGRQALVSMASDPLVPIRLTQGLDWRVFGFTMALAVLATVMFGLFPALKMSQVHVSESLKSAAAGAVAPDRQRLRKGLVSLQIALSVVMLSGTALMLRTVAGLRAVDAGFRTNNALLARFAVEWSSQGLERLTSIARPLRERLCAVPGIQAVGFSSYGGLSNSYQTTSVALPTGPLPPGPEVRLNNVSPGYFEAYGIELIRGRTFLDTDTAGAHRVAVINQSAAQRFFPGENAVGRLIAADSRYEPDSSTEIVGIVRDAKWRNLREPPQATVYIPLEQRRSPALFAAIRTRGEPAAMAGSLRSVIREFDPQLGVDVISTLEEDVEASIRTERMLARLSAAFGLLALLLVSIGIYGIISYAVSRRTREIGVRLALGASPGRVRLMVLREVGAFAGAGMLAGLPVAVGSGILIEKQLYGVKAGDVMSLSATVAILAAVALVSAWIPARRASRVDPMTALRCE